MSDLYLSSTVGMKAGDTIEIMLDSGQLFTTTIMAISSGNAILIWPTLPTAASSGNTVIDLTQNVVVAPSRAELSTDLGG